MNLFFIAEVALSKVRKDTNGTKLIALTPTRWRGPNSNDGERGHLCCSSPPKTQDLSIFTLSPALTTSLLLFTMKSSMLFSALLLCVQDASSFAFAPTKRSSFVVGPLAMSGEEAEPYFQFQQIPIATAGAKLERFIECAEESGQCDVTEMQNMIEGEL